MSKPNHRIPIYDGGDGWKLNVGAGDDRLVGYINYDIRALKTVDCVGSATKLPFKNNSFVRVHASHVLEHLGRFEWQDAFDEMCRVCKRDGIIEIHVPNPVHLLWRMLDEKENHLGLVESLFGGQEFEANFHRWTFTLQIFRDAFEVNRIELIANNWDARGWDFWVAGRKT